MMGGTSVTNHDLRKAMQLIDEGRLFRLWRARRVLESDTASGVDTGVSFVNMKKSALYKYVSALVWLLKEDDRAWAANLAEAQDSAGWSEELEANTLYEHATLLVEHKWRVDMAPRYLGQVVALSRSKRDRVRRARALTTWGKLLYGQKLYDEARSKLTDAERVWTTLRNQPGRLLSSDEKQWTMETDIWLLKTLVALRVDREEIKRLANKAIWRDPALYHKATALALLLSSRKIQQ